MGKKFYLEISLGGENATWRKSHTEKMPREKMPHKRMEKGKNAK